MTTSLEQIFAKEIVKKALQVEYADDGSPAFMQLFYKKCIFCGADNLESAKNDDQVQPVRHEESCVYLKASELISKTE